MTHILIVDDDIRLKSLLKKFLQKHNFIVSTAYSAENAIEGFNYFIYDLILLDVMMEGQSGIEFAKDIRQGLFNIDANISILMLSARIETHERIEGLESGVDDYLPKPFEPEELLLRIKSLLRRTEKPKKLLNDDDNTIEGKAQWRLEKKYLRLYKNDLVYDLTENETFLVDVFLTNPYMSFTREVLHKRLFTEDMPVDSRAIDVTIARLRKKIEENIKKPIHFITQRGEGYVFVP